MKTLTLAIPIFTSLLFAQNESRTEIPTTTIAAVETAQSSADIWFDVKYHDDRGKLVVTDRGVNFENVSNAKHSRSWTYSQIKEFKRDGDEIKIEPYSGNSFEFHVKGKAMSEEIYRTIADRIVAARSR